jgi:hypothetical protein
MKILVTVVGFVLIFLSGYWLNKSGQPFNVAVLAIHKLVAVATIVYVAVTVLRINKIAPLGQVEWIACIAAGVFFLLTIASGGWLSAVRTMPAVVNTLHQVLPFLTALSTAAFLYLLFRRG